MKCQKCNGTGKVEFGTKTGNTVCFACKGMGNYKVGELIASCGFGLVESDVYGCDFGKLLNWDRLIIRHSYKKDQICFSAQYEQNGIFCVYRFDKNENNGFKSISRKSIIDGMSKFKKFVENEYSE